MHRACLEPLVTVRRIHARVVEQNRKGSDMYGDVFLIERPGRPVSRARKVPLGDTRGRNEAWLQELLFSQPDILPVSNIDASFGPLLPLCRELRTEAGPVDLAFINATGRLTLVQCKLWRNPEERRKVVAQILDYARAISQWSYSDLQRQVAIATGTRSNNPFELAQAAYPSLVEHRFADAVVQTMRSGRLLLLVAGDGIREDVAALAELINRNAASAFAFGMVEVALYDLEDEGMAVQPRVIAKTHVFERNVVVIRSGEGLLAGDVDEETPDEDTSRNTDTSPARRRGADESTRHEQHRSWWQPIIDMRFDDPDQGRPKLHFPNNVRAPLPWPGTSITAFDTVDRCGVFLSGRGAALLELSEKIEADLDEIVRELPNSTVVRRSDDARDFDLSLILPNSTFSDDDQKREWLQESLNAFVNVLRPRIKRLVAKRA